MTVTGHDTVIIQTPLGNLELVERMGKLVSCTWTDRVPAQTSERAVLEQAMAQLDAFFLAKRQHFNLPFALRGTPFQQAVWQQIETIPYGQTCCYQDIARAINRPAAARAVGLAAKHNPLVIVIPCHRVICRSGELGGYMGSQYDLKQALLNLERSLPLRLE